jgi:hypothetical protein
LHEGWEWQLFSAVEKNRPDFGPRNSGTALRAFRENPIVPNKGRHTSAENSPLDAVPLRVVY